METTSPKKKCAQRPENTRTSFYVDADVLKAAKKIAKHAKAKSFSAWCVKVLKRARGLPE